MNAQPSRRFSNVDLVLARRKPPRQVRDEIVSNYHAVENVGETVDWS